MLLDTIILGGGGLIILWLYKENEQAKGLKKIYLLYIFPPDLHTLGCSIFFNPAKKKKKLFSLCCKPPVYS
jgi:hypothetical protein